MDGFGFSPGWSKVSNVRPPKMGAYNMAQTARMFFSETTTPTPPKYIPLASGTTEKASFGSPGSGYATGQYSGFPPTGGPGGAQRGRGLSRGGWRGRGRGGTSGGNTYSKKGAFAYSGMGTCDAYGGVSQMRVKKEKQYSTAGKTAAMILNELYPDFKDQCTYETLLDMKVPRFVCKFNVQGKEFSADASSKKIAKQLACERALKDLRPDIVLDVPSFEETEAGKRLAALEMSKNSSTETDKTAGKKKKADPLSTSNSLHDYFLRLCRAKESETGVRFNPEFSFIESPAVNGAKAHLKRFLCKLVMAEQGKVYSHEGVGKSAGKNWVIRQALIEIFNVGHAELKSIERRAITLRPGNPVTVLLQALSFYDRSMLIDVDTADGKLPEPNSRFVAKITLDNEKTIVGPEEESKQKAKDAACLKVLTEELELTMPTPEDISLKRAASVLSPCYALYQLMLKQSRTTPPDIVYSEATDISEGAGKPPSFKCTLTVNSKETFEGIGQSKKAAKSAAAEKALAKIFNLDMLSEDAFELFTAKRIKTDEALEFSLDIADFVRTEYENLCHAQGCPLTTHIAAFVLVSPEGERKMVSLGAGRNWIVDGRLLANSQGTVLIHMQNAVLARRGFLLYLHKQIENCSDPNCVVERSPNSNKFRLKPGYKVVLYAAFPPLMGRPSGSGKQKLMCHVGNIRARDVPDNLQTMDEIISTGQINVMSITDKMLKWNYLGLQGALLSYVLEPIYMTHLCIGSPTHDGHLMQAVLLRFGDARKSELVVKSVQKGIRPQGEMYHDWVEGVGTIERLDPSTGRTVTGSPSRLCKSELFESWSRVLAAMGEDMKPLWSCAEAKRGESVYMNVLENFMAQLKAFGFGQWQRKDQAVDCFQLISFDA
uniref:Double-stranded RNA-specific editase B2 n=2 Tax=Parascaris univalens TaxID=6257 RepID=A0A915C2S6_PARUN